jgi:hypothetical protein
MGKNRPGTTKWRIVFGATLLTSVERRKRYKVWKTETQNNK